MHPNIGSKLGVTPPRLPPGARLARLPLLQPHHDLPVAHDDGGEGRHEL